MGVNVHNNYCLEIEWSLTNITRQCIFKSLNERNFCSNRAREMLNPNK